MVLGARLLTGGGLYVCTFVATWHERGKAVATRLV